MTTSIPTTPAESLRSFLELADRFTAQVDAVTDWSGASPCSGWDGAGVLDHVVDSHRDFLTGHGIDLGERPTGDPAEIWRAHLAALRAALDDEVADQEYDGHFGRTTIGDTMLRFYGFDLVVHRWDIAQASGSDTEWTAAEMDLLDAAIPGFGDALYAEGVCGPPVDVPEDAPRQVRLLGVLGRAA